METIRLNLVPVGATPVCHAAQYDDGRQIKLELFNGAAAYQIQAGDTFEGMGGVDAVDIELERHRASTLREGHPVGERLHDEDTLAGHLVAERQLAILCEVESLALIGHRDGDATLGSIESHAHLLGAVGAIAMHDGIPHRLRHRHRHGSVIITHVALAAEMKQTLLHTWQIRYIRLYNKRFRHINKSLYRLQKYK